MTSSMFNPADAIPRDRWKRPLIVPEDGGKPVAYTRPSTLAKVLDDKIALTRWKQRQTAVGIAMRTDLVGLVLAKRGDKKALDEAVETAMAAAASDAAANTGTTLHAFCEHVDAGTMPEHLPAELIPDLDAYEQATRGLKMLASEVFVVTDEIGCAGSFDRLVAMPDGRLLVADIKTGQQEPSYPHATATQIAIYAHGRPYEHPGIRKASLAEAGVSLTTGLMIHLPAGQARCDLYEVDLTAGWDAAVTATWARRWLKSKPIAPYNPGAAPAATGPTAAPAA